jgi:photosystem II stability/assembly factor-like uncharacterized protein
MKIFRKILSCLLFIISFHPAHSQWLWQNPIPQGNLLNSVFFVDPQLGYAVGEKGTIIKTTDGGIHWQVLDCEPQGDFRDIWFTDPLNGWIASSLVNWYGVSILHTDDGGESWEIQWSFAAFEDLTAIRFIDPFHGFAVGSIENHMLVTQDGGVHWEPYPVPVFTNSLYTIFFLNYSLGWTAGTGGIIYKTVDSGNTWEGHSVSGSPVQSLFFVDTLTGYACGNRSLMLKTTDGGLNWNPIPTGGLASDTYYSVCFINPDTGWVTGETYYGHNIFLKTNDGGLTWQSADAGLNYEGKDIFFVDHVKGWVVGQRGEIAKTNTAGEQWFTQGHRIPGSFTRVQFLDSMNGWITGRMYEAWGDTFTGDIVYKTTNGGWNWEMKLSDTSFYYTQMQFLNPDTGWVTGESINGNSGIIMKTCDGGTTWVDQSPDSLRKIYGLSFINPEKGWVAGKGNAYNCGEIYRTTDGGLNWELQLSDSLYHFTAICFVNDQSGWAIRYLDDISRTTDGGQTWTTQSTGAGQFLFDVLFVDDTTGWIGGWYTLTKTVDGGNSWIWIPYWNPDINDLCFINADTGWAAGGFDEGIIFRTYDSGQNWIQLTTPTRHIISGISFPDANNGWAVNGSGAILHSGNSGGFPVSARDEGTIMNMPEPNVSVFPNPAANFCSVSWSPEKNHLVSIGIYNLPGACLKQWTGFTLTGTGRTDLDISALEPGMYYLVIQFDTSTAVKKLIISE